MIDSQTIAKVDQFILEQIASVSHLEALLLVWNTRPKEWSVSEMAKALYVSADYAERILQELVGRGLIQRCGENDNSYCYQIGSEERDTLLSSVDTIYRRELVRISSMIHSNASVAVRDFARAFRFKKD